MQVGIYRVAERRVPGRRPGREDGSRMMLGQRGQFGGAGDLTGLHQVGQAGDVGREGVTR